MLDEVNQSTAGLDCLKRVSAFCGGGRELGRCEGGGNCGRVAQECPLDPCPGQSGQEVISGGRWMPGWRIGRIGQCWDRDADMRVEEETGLPHCRAWGWRLELRMPRPRSFPQSLLQNFPVVEESWDEKPDWQCRSPPARLLVDKRNIENLQDAPLWGSMTLNTSWDLVLARTQYDIR